MTVNMYHSLSTGLISVFLNFRLITKLLTAVHPKRNAMPGAFSQCRDALVHFSDRRTTFSAIL